MLACAVAGLLAVTAAAAAPPGPGVWIGADDPNVRYTGRFDFSDPKQARFAWPGCSITARFRGAEISMVLADTGSPRKDEVGLPFRNWYDVFVDGRHVKTFIVKPGRHVYKLAAKLDESAHEVTVFKRTEPCVGVSTFVGFRLPEGGRALPPPPRPKRRIEFIGDSITAGLDALRVGYGCIIAEENNYVTFGAVAARALGAEYVCIAYSGGGVHRKPRGGIWMPGLYLRTLPDDPKSSWDFRAHPKPDVVVIHLGTNDGYSKDVVKSYAAFISRLRKRYPKAHIFCVSGPTTPWNRIVIESVAPFLKKKDSHVHRVEFSAPEGYDGNCHPDVPTHRLLADVLVKAIRSKLDW